MARAFRCKKCGTGYTTTGNEIPPVINWDDGHKCVLIEVESKLNKPQGPCSAHSQFSNEEEERERRMDIIGQNGNDGLHYDEERREEDDYNG